METLAELPNPHVSYQNEYFTPYQLCKLYDSTCTSSRLLEKNRCRNKRLCVEWQKTTVKMVISSG